MNSTCIKLPPSLSLFNQEIFVLVPFKTNTEWNKKLYSIGSKQNREDINWAYRGFERLLQSKDFFLDYFAFWREALESYEKRNPNAAYWFTNGCGQPIPRPEQWPRRDGTGYESVSDGKTSVGMDRTDDIKKGTYQVLKLGAEGKPSRNYAYKTGIVSNIHAARHFDEYLGNLKDIVWTRSSVEASTIGDLPSDTELFNLFDGIVTLTETMARDSWVRKVFDF